MTSLTRKNPVFYAAVLLAILVLTSIACSVGGLTLGKNSAEVEITLNEDKLNKLIQNSDVHVNTPDDVLLENVTKVEMHDGFMRVFGTGKTPSGAEVDGSYDVSFGVENDVLAVKIIAVDIEGITLDDPRIVKANEEIAKGLIESVTESNGEVTYKEAYIKDGQLHMKVLVKFNVK